MQKGKRKNKKNEMNKIDMCFVLNKKSWCMELNSKTKLFLRKNCFKFVSKMQCKKVKGNDSLKRN